MLIVLNNIEATVYLLSNSTKMFNFYKDKYHRTYKNSTFEKRAYKNFVNNLNRINELNEKTPGSETFFVLNKYADIDQGDFEEHFALNVTPCMYFHVYFLNCIVLCPPGIGNSQ